MTETEQTTELIRELVARFVEKPEALKIAKQEADDGSCFFLLAGDPEDGGMLAGTGGSHDHALSLLVAAFGLANRRPYTFRIVLGPRPESRGKREKRAAIEYNPEPTRALLAKIVGELPIAEFAVEVGPGSGPRMSLNFAFTIRVKSPRDLRTMKKQLDPTRPETIEGALGTLFRAIARKDGVYFSIAVATEAP